MAGARFPISIDIDDAELRSVLRALRDHLGNLKPVFQDLGETLLNSTRTRFQSQTAPDGKRWKDLSLAYAARKPRHKDKVLTLWGHLRGTLNYQASADELLVGTPLIYGATHQFGRGAIPARPFLGLSAEDCSDLLDALNEYLAKVT